MIINTPMGLYRVPAWFNNILPMVLFSLVMVLYVLLVYFIYYLESDGGFFANLCVYCGTFGICLLFWAFWKASKNDPGYVPIGVGIKIKTNLTLNKKVLKGDGFSELEETDIEQKKSNPSQDKMSPNDSRLCQFCKIKQPERSHHCSQCGRCVLNMDHHCIWTGNCVGLKNRKAFVLILFWGSFALFFGTLLCLPNLYGFFTQAQVAINNSEFSSFVRYAFSMMLTFSAAANFVGLAYFCYYHLSLIRRGLTTLQEMFAITDNQYDLGELRNLKFYFGNQYLLWFLPIGSPLGDGYYWSKQDHDLV